MASKQVWTATGRRKRAVAQVRMAGGVGNITINGVAIDEYMPNKMLIMDIKQPWIFWSSWCY